MAMNSRTASPWWASLIFGVGLLFVFVSERLVTTSPDVRMAMTGFGLLVILAITGARAWATFGSRGARRRVERVLLGFHVLTVLALVVYLFSTSWGQSLFGVSKESAPRWSGGLMAIYTVMFLCSTVPVLMVELSLGVALRDGFDVRTDTDDDSVEIFRVREMAWSGLTIALAAGFLMATCGVAKERNAQRDVSYFKTSTPGESTKNILLQSSEPIKVNLFFPEGSEVQTQVRAYFDTLAAATNKLEVYQRDRMQDGSLAQKYKVAKDGIVVMSRGEGDAEKSFTFEVDTDLDKARRATGKLRNLDRDVNALLMKLARDKRKAYITSGHGELNHPESVPSGVLVPIRRTTVLRKELGDLNYEVKDLTLGDLSKDVPADAALVIVLRPTLLFTTQEFAALERYLQKGGKLLYAVDPIGEQNLGPLEARLGVKAIPGGRLTDDVNHYVVRQNNTDRRYTGSTQYAAHATTTSMARDKIAFLIDAAALEDAAFAPGGQPTRTVVLRSLDSSYLDFNDNFEMDGTEKKQKWNLVYAVEGPKLDDKDGGKDGFRAMVFSDAEMFADYDAMNARAANPVMYGRGMFKDVVKWLGGEESFVGETVSEEDKAIHRTKGQDQKWFLLTMIGAPLIVLVVGLFFTLRRRSRASKKELVTT